MPKTLKVMIIAPAWREGSLWSISVFRFPLLSPLVVAALCPSNWQPLFVDENTDAIDFSAEVDLVALTSMTALSGRAYAIAAPFRQRGVPVVMGGLHASACPEEALEHVDAVVIGEAEDTWERLLHDCERGELAKRYCAPGAAQLEGRPIARRDLLRGHKYSMVNAVQTGRGCPHQCEFCRVTSFHGGSYRFRPVAEVVEEVRGLTGKWVFFVDDNIIGDVAHAKELFKALTPLGISWVSQGSVAFASDCELLSLAAESGCMGMFLGLESLNQESLALSGKYQNRASEYTEVVGKIHAAGIGVEAAFVFGLDGDDNSVFERTVRFCKDNSVEAAQFTILTPFPGTPLFERLLREGRILHTDWSRYDCANVVYQPARMTAGELFDGFHQAYRGFYSWSSIVWRLLKSRRFPQLFLPLNLGFRRASRFLKNAASRQGNCGLSEEH